MNEETVKVMDHAHWSKHVDVEHPLNGSNIRVDSCHRIRDATTNKDASQHFLADFLNFGLLFS